MKVSVAELEEAKEKRLSKYGKIRKSKRSLGISISMGAKIYRQQMVSEAGSKRGSAKLLKEEKISAGLLKEKGRDGLLEEQISTGSKNASQKTKKTKIERLSPEINEIVLARAFAAHPRIPDWKLYRKSLAFAELLEKQHEDMYQQVLSKGYHEIEVTDDEDENTEE
ncbi:hypothetical protein PR202_ga13500 [Eleusine coracana subsp. coracana]|uniref:Uncharacterized protein n=1 Tax=Eleusine coracana subsp. coracana TaxID=191504 RepID=A0AAV5CF40_ELECO|nr:hypothetical protein PR202_ga13500 [Eleusine coracana subsp. coracana]